MTYSTGLVFVIDTAEYAGNFEREMCAWITGIIGDCGVGRETADAASYTMSEALQGWCYDNIIQVPDEHGCARPVTVWRVPKGIHEGNGQNNGVGIYVEDAPGGQILAEMKDRARYFCDNFRKDGGVPSRFAGFRDDPIPLTGFRLVSVRMVENTLYMDDA